MKVVGKIISISELSVKVLLMDDNVNLRDVLVCKHDGVEDKFEVVELEENIASLLPFRRVNGLRKGLEVELLEGGLQMEYSPKILGRIYNSFGEGIDGKKEKSEATKNVYDRKLSVAEISITSETNSICETIFFSELSFS